MDSFDNLSASEKAEASELQRMIAVEQQKAQFQAQDLVIKRMVVGRVAEPDQYIIWIDIIGQDRTANVHVHTFTDVCWDKCVDSPGSKLDYRTETCLQSCVERFIDTTLVITNRFTQMVQKGGH